MAWLWVFIAGLLEVGWAMGLKASDGFTRPWISLLTALGMILSFVFLAQAMKTLPVGTAYSVWTGVGAVGTVILGIVFYNEPKDLPRLWCVGLIVIGIVGLKIVSTDPL